MKVLIIGSGGREHALAWKAAQSPGVSEVLVAPGNAGTATEPGVRNIDIESTAIPELIALARAEDVGLTIVGPEAPLVVRHRRCVHRCRLALLRALRSGGTARRLEGLHEGFSGDEPDSDCQLRSL